MRKLNYSGFILFFCVVCLGVPLSSPGGEQTNAAPMESPIVIVSLRDGSRISGRPFDGSLSCQTTYADMDVKFDLLNSLKIEPDGQASLVMNSGDKLQGRIKNEAIELASALGKLRVPVSTIREIEALSAKWLSGEIKEGLVLHYSFDATGGQTVTNEAGTDLNGYDFAGSQPEGFFGPSRHFNGENQYVHVPNPPVLNSKAFTIALWCRSTDTAPNSQRGLLGKRKDRYDSNAFWLYLQGQMLNLQMAGTSWSNNRMSASAEAIRNRWGLVTVTFDGSRTQLYVNDDNAGQIDVHNYYSGNDLNFLIGAGSYDSSGQNPRYFWQGDIDEAMLFDRALSAEEVKRLFRSAYARKTTSLLPLSKTPPAMSTNAIQVVLDLKDGSHLKGEMKPGSLRIENSSLGLLSVPLETLQAMRFSEDGTNVSAVLRNNDVLIGVSEFPAFDLAMIFGHIKADRSLMKLLSVGAESAAPSELFLPRISAPPVPVNEAEIERLATNLVTGTEAEREESVKRLVAIGPDAIPILKKNLTDAEPAARWWIEAAIQQIEEKHRRATR